MTKYPPNPLRQDLLDLEVTRVHDVFVGGGHLDDEQVDLLHDVFVLGFRAPEMEVMAKRRNRAIHAQLNVAFDVVVAECLQEALEQFSAAEDAA